MKAKTSKVFKCFKFSVYFCLILNCIFGLILTVFASYLLIFREEGYISKTKTIVLYFLIIPIVFTLLTNFGWSSVKRKNINWIKLFAVLLAFEVILLIGGSLWCFTSLSQVHNKVLVKLEETFSTVAVDSNSENWWNNIQIKLKCCGLHGPTDYQSKQGIPFSCCSSDLEDHTKGSCTFLFQKGCSTALSNHIREGLILIGLVALAVAFLQVPSVFLSWSFANKISRDGI